MENANSKEYLEKIKIQVIENLKKTAHAPSVQLTDIPRTTLLGSTDDDDLEGELDDLDEDENKDTRHTKRRWDQHIERDDEFEESDDEEEAHANGVRRQNGASKRRNIMDYKNSAVASDVEMDSVAPTPEPNEVDDEVTALATEVNAEVNDEIMEEKAQNLTAAEVIKAPETDSNVPTRAQSAKPIGDGLGDVEMSTSLAVAATPASPTENPPVSEAPISPTASASPDVPTTQTETEVTPTEVKEEVMLDGDNVDVAGEVSKEVAEDEEL
jgi:histone deacetylase 1/2